MHKVLPAFIISLTLLLSINSLYATHSRSCCFEDISSDTLPRFTLTPDVLSILCDTNAQHVRPINFLFNLDRLRSRNSFPKRLKSCTDSVEKACEELMRVSYQLRESSHIELRPEATRNSPLVLIRRVYTDPLISLGSMLVEITNDIANSLDAELVLTTLDGSQELSTVWQGTLHATINTLELHKSQFPEGTYLLKVRTSNGEDLSSMKMVVDEE